MAASCRVVVSVPAARPPKSHAGGGDLHNRRNPLTQRRQRRQPRKISAFEHSACVLQVALRHKLWSRGEPFDFTKIYAEGGVGEPSAGGQPVRERASTLSPPFLVLPLPSTAFHCLPVPKLSAVLNSTSAGGCGLRIGASGQACETTQDPHTTHHPNAFFSLLDLEKTQDLLSNDRALLVALPRF